MGQAELSWNALECMGLSCVFRADTGRPHLCQGGCVRSSLSRLLVKFNQMVSDLGIISQDVNPRCIGRKWKKGV